MNVLNFIKPQAKLPRNGFDLSQRHLFSAKVGQLLPILSLECVPGDFHEINVLEMARSMQVHTDAFVRLKQNFEFYFVPYTQLWSSFNNFVTQQSEVYNLSMPDGLFTNVPYLRMEELAEFVANDTETDIFGFSIAEGAKRLLDLLGYGNFYDEDSENTSAYRGIKCNPFRLLAYQKIFSDFYRQPFYDLRTPSDDEYAACFNVDSLSTCPVDRNTLSLRYRQWKKDYFTGLIPSMQFGDVSFVSLGDFDLQVVEPQNLSGLPLYKAPQSSMPYSNKVSLQSNPNQPVTFNSSAQIDVYQILKAQAMQKWKENVARSGSHVVDNLKAHYGVVGDYEYDHRCQFIGSFDSPLTIDEVLNTSNYNGELGEIGGKGVGTANGSVKFNCKDFGVLMCIYSIVPSSEYNANGVDKANTLVEHFDFWTPEFDNCGMEPVVRHQLNSLPSYVDTATTYPSHMSEVLGYAPRNLHLKLAFDKVHGQFMSYFRTTDNEGQEFVRHQRGIFSHWCIPRESSQLLDNRLSDFYISPFEVDTIFVQGADSTQETDQFIVNCNFDIKSVRNMPVLGLPNW